MSAYLDKTGVQYLWNKIKLYVDSKISAGGGFTYSTDEKWTGDYWIDGKKIYSKTFIFTLTSNQTQSFNHGLSLGDFRSIDYKASGFSTSGNKLEFQIASYYDSASYVMGYGIYDDTISLKFGQNWVNSFNGGKAFITIRYTKN